MNTDGRDNSGYLSYLYVNFVDCKAKNTWQMIYIKSSYLFDSNWPFDRDRSFDLLFPPQIIILIHKKDIFHISPD